MDAAEAFLGVEQSVCGRRWRARAGGDGEAAALAARLGLPEIVARLLAQRGVGVAEAPGFLAPRLREQLPDPLHLRDMGAAVARLVQAIRGGERIVVFGDYDVDGATAAALLLRFFAAVGGSAAVYVPDRLREGYGPNAPALLRLKEEGAGVVVTVDCGATAHAPLAAAAEAGLDVIVVDHHVGEPLVPRARAVVNPNRLDDDSPHGALAAVGVAFLLVVALNRALREAGWYETRGEPDLLQWLDLVALGTVCDVVPLTGINRALVAQGIKVARQGANPGLRALAAVGEVKEPIGAYHLGFVLGPRVNAGGRVGAADLGARLLATDDPALAGELAARLKERYERPACVVALADGIGRGSGRSVPGVELGPAVIAARQAGLLINGGGHAMAAGFTVAADRLDALHAFLAVRLGDGRNGEPAAPELAIDGALAAAGAVGGLIAELETLAPFGAANPEPRFAFPGLLVAHVEPVGGAHLRCTFADQGGPPALKAIAFRVADTPLGRFLSGSRGRAIHVAGHLRRDTYRGGDAVQLVIDDAAPAE